jgi:acetyl-CoA carboxylase carboxyltransferase component
MSIAVSAEPFDDEPALSPLERIERLCDPGSVDVIRSAVRSPTLGANARDGDGVVGAVGAIRGRTVFCYAQDARFLGGSLGEVHAETVVRVLELAERGRGPVVGIVESAGARLQDGVAALHGYGRIFRQSVRLSGRVPQISVITGVSAGGGAYSPALTDFTIMARNACSFLTGPEIVRQAMGEDVGFEELGGPRVHERNGVCHFVRETPAAALDLVPELLSYLPQSSREAPPAAAPVDPAPGDPGALLPADGRGVYDVRWPIARIVDGGRLLEVAPRWARNLVTGFCRIEGRPLGIIANQSCHLGGVLDAESAQKGARFVRSCNIYGLPILALVDTPGFLPGTKQERGAVIRHGAKLVHAFAEATVPKLSVVTRKAYGGAYITMNAKGLGADFAFAWPKAEIGVMAAGQAVGITHRRELALADEASRERIARDYVEQHVAASAAVRRGFADELIEPAETRGRVARALAAMEPIRDDRRPASTNIPL